MWTVNLNGTKEGPKNFKVGIYIEGSKTMMSLEYSIENIVYKIPKISLTDLEQQVENHRSYPSCYENRSAEITLPILPTEDGAMIEMEDLNYKPKKKMTLKEVEKKLGYEIELESEG